MRMFRRQVWEESASPKRGEALWHTGAPLARLIRERG